MHIHGIQTQDVYKRQDHGRTLVNELEQAGIKATIIGHTTDSRDKVIYRQGKAANLEAPRQDELYKIYSENNRR